MNMPRKPPIRAKQVAGKDLGALALLLFIQIAHTLLLQQLRGFGIDVFTPVFQDLPRQHIVELVPFVWLAHDVEQLIIGKRKDSGQN